MIVRHVKASLSKLPPFRRVVVAISGGPDSVALAHSMIRLGYEVTLAHLDHGLRGKESDADLAFVQTLAGKWGVPLVTHSVRICQQSNVEAVSRSLRYAFLEHTRKKTRASFIAVGHHQDDQVETVLMHMLRGAGWRGLTGMRPLNGKVIRPFLGLTKAKIVAYLKKNDLAFRTDRSNTDNRFTRNLLRNIVIPQLKKKHRTLEREILEIAEFAEKQIRTLEIQARNWIRSHVSEHSFDRISFAVLPEDLQSEIIFSIAGHRDLYRPAVNEVKSLIRTASTGKRKTAGGARFEIRYDKVVVGTPLKNTLSRKTLNLQLSRKLKKGENRWGKWIIRFEDKPRGERGASANGKTGVWVRSWKRGDRFRPAGLGGTKKLQDFFTDSKIPRQKRDSIPIFTDKNGEILAVGNLRVAEGSHWMKGAVKLERIKKPEIDEVT